MTSSKRISLLQLLLIKMQHLTNICKTMEQLRTL